MATDHPKREGKGEGEREKKERGEREKGEGDWPPLRPVAAGDRPGRRRGQQREREKERGKRIEGKREREGLSPLPPPTHRGPGGPLAVPSRQRCTGDSQPPGAPEKGGVGLQGKEKKEEEKEEEKGKGKEKEKKKGLI